MDQILPFRTISPGLRHKPMTNLKFSKLSLMNRAGKIKIHKESNRPTDHLKKTKENVYNDILTSDDSVEDESFAIVKGHGKPSSVIQSNFCDDSVVFSSPVAESTRFELQQLELNSSTDSSVTSHLETNDEVPSSSSSKYLTAFLDNKDCEDSIICLSDHDESSTQAASSKNLSSGKQQSIILISSDESDFESKPSERFARDKIAERVGHTVLLESSDSDSSHPHQGILIPVNRSSSSPSNNSASLFSDQISLIASDKDSSNKNVSHSSIGSLVSNSVASDSNSNGRFVKRVSKCKDSSRQNVSSLKKTFHHMTLDSPQDKQNPVNCTPERDLEATQNTQTPNTLTNEKFHDIRKWVLNSRLYGDGSERSVGSQYHNESVGGLSNPSIPGFGKRLSSSLQNVNSQNISSGGCDNKTPCKPDKFRRLSYLNLSNNASPKELSHRKSSAGYCSPSLNESEDRFESFLMSIKEKGIDSQAKQVGIRTSSSFINDSSLDESCSPSIYHKAITRTVRKEIQTVKRQFTNKDNCQKQIVCRPVSDHEEKTSSSDSLTHYIQCEPRMIKQKLTYDGDDSDSDSDFKVKPSTKAKGIKGIKKTTFKKLVGSRNEDEQSKLNHLTSTTPSRVLPKLPFQKPIYAPSTGLTPQANLYGKAASVPYSPIRTFLSSLSGPANQPGLRSHPEAERYYKDFKKNKEELSRRLFKLYNREVFDSRLPQDMSVEWNARMVRTAGFCYCKLTRKAGATTRSARIVLSTKVLDSANRLRDTLIHEMCHAAVWLLNNISGGHGPFWKAWAEKARKRFPELPPITRCHDYKIETKFMYRCTDCGYSFGRHSKSLDTEKKRCGYCYGKFEVHLTKHVNQDFKENAPPKAQRNPSAFALFVKENYAIFKKENPHLKHGDIMKKLGEKFSILKTKSTI